MEGNDVSDGLALCTCGCAGYHIAKYASYQGCTFCHKVGSLIGIADAVDALKLISINLGEGLSVKL